MFKNLKRVLGVLVALTLIIGNAPFMNIKAYAKTTGIKDLEMNKNSLLSQYPKA